jgi:hypothetical protein
MLVLRFLRPLAVAVVLVSALGCPSSDEKPSVVRANSSETKASPADEPIASAKPPVAEFQQPPAVPPSEPPPRLPSEPNESPSGSRLYSGGLELPPVFEQDATVPVDKAAPPAKSAKPAGKVANSRDLPAVSSEDAVQSKRLTKVPRKPFDPIEQNGRYFVGWPKPKVAIAITGMERGYIEPCGCAGIDRMTGGMGRRYAFFQQLRQKGWPLVAVDVGGLAGGFGREAEIKFRTLVESKEKMGYAAVGFGPDDLRLPAAELVSVAADVNGKPSIFVSANVGLFGFDQNVTQTSRVVKVGDVKIGIAAILGMEYQKEFSNNPEIATCAPEAALDKIVPELKKKADYLILLANSTQAEAIGLAKRYPQFSVVVVAEGPELPPHDWRAIPGTRTLLVTVGRKGMSVIVLGLYDGPRPSVRYQRVLLDSRFDLSADAAHRAPPEMKRLMAGYQDQLKLLGFAQLGLRPAANPLADANGRYVGSQKCESCHEPSYDIWKRSGHAHAYKTLETQDPPRNYDPECISCHVVGWHPTKFFPYEGGFESVEKTPRLKNVGCEDCHGPGEKHCNAELGKDKELLKKYRKAVRITKEQSKKEQCTTCHDLDNSPEFNFDKYWPLIEHHEEKAE